MILYTHRFIPEGSAGCMRVFLGIPLIFIRPEYRGDRGLLKHELQHVYQHLFLVGLWSGLITGFYCAGLSQVFGINSLWLLVFGLSLYPLLYQWIPEYRLHCEVSAYRIQAKYNPEHIELYAQFISEDYNLPVSKTSALSLLKE